ncbi:MAG: hypothetical protein IV100_08255 [Myxococcales bacterium]|nr:hypothetical protein [Myxococcales bacterium]
MPTPVLSVRSSSRLVIFIVALTAALAASCARPEVDVPEQSGGAGDFCISAGDCAAASGASGALQCFERRCCADESCPTRCDALLASALPAADVTPGGGDGTRRVHQPDERRLIRGTCISLCCQNRTSAEIEHVLSSPTFAPVHLVE